MEASIGVEFVTRNPNVYTKIEEARRKRWLRNGNIRNRGRMNLCICRSKGREKRREEEEEEVYSHTPI